MGTGETDSNQRAPRGASRTFRHRGPSGPTTSRSFAPALSNSPNSFQDSWVLLSAGCDPRGPPPVTNLLPFDVAAPAAVPEDGMHESSAHRSSPLFLLPTWLATSQLRLPQKPGLPSVLFGGLASPEPGPVRRFPAGQSSNFRSCGRTRSIPASRRRASGTGCGRQGAADLGSTPGALRRNPTCRGGASDGTPAAPGFLVERTGAAARRRTVVPDSTPEPDLHLQRPDPPPPTPPLLRRPIATTVLRPRMRTRTIHMPKIPRLPRRNELTAPSTTNTPLRHKRSQTLPQHPMSPPITL